jgi:ribosome-binding factor A
MAEVKRAVRVAERVRESLAMLFIRDARDPRLANVVVSRIEMPDDLRSARVYVRTLDGSGQEETMIALERAAGMIRREITARVKLRYAPTLQFFFDSGQDNVTRVEELLEEVRADDRRRSGE